MRETQKIRHFCALMLVGVLGIGTPISIYGEKLRNLLSELKDETN